MQIRFISTLTAEDEGRLAAMIVDTAKALLAHSPLGYMLRIETTDAKILEHNKVAPSATVNEIPRQRQARVHGIGIQRPAIHPGSAEDHSKPKDRPKV